MDDAGIAWIDDTNVKVIEVIADHVAYGHSPEQIQKEHPHLTLAQVHAAFAYYCDHCAELDAEMERRYQQAEAMCQARLNQPRVTTEQARAQRQVLRRAGEKFSAGAKTETASPRPPHPTNLQFTGIIPSGVDAREVHLQHVVEEHR